MDLNQIEILNVVHEQTTDGFLMMSKLFEKEVTEGADEILDGFRYEEANYCKSLKTSLSETTPGAPRKIAKCVAMLSNRFSSESEARSVKPFVSVLITHVAATDTAISTSARPAFKEVTQ